MYPQFVRGICPYICSFMRNFCIGVSEYLVVDILAQILLTLLSFIGLLILHAISIDFGGWFLFGVSYYLKIHSHD